MKRRIDAINRFTVGCMAYFAFADTPRPFAISTTGCAAGYGWALEGMEGALTPAARRRNLIALGVSPGIAHQ